MGGGGHDKLLLGLHVRSLLVAGPWEKPVTSFLSRALNAWSEHCAVLSSICALCCSYHHAGIHPAHLGSGTRRGRRSSNRARGKAQLHVLLQPMLLPTTPLSSGLWVLRVAVGRHVAAGCPAVVSHAPATLPQQLILEKLPVLDVSRKPTERQKLAAVAGPCRAAAGHHALLLDGKSCCPGTKCAGDALSHGDGGSPAVGALEWLQQAPNVAVMM